MNEKINDLKIERHRIRVLLKYARNEKQKLRLEERFKELQKEIFNLEEEDRWNTKKNSKF